MANLPTLTAEEFLTAIRSGTIAIPQWGTDDTSIQHLFEINDPARRAEVLRELTTQQEAGVESPENKVFTNLMWDSGKENALVEIFGGIVMDDPAVTYRGAYTISHETASERTPTELEL